MDKSTAISLLLTIVGVLLGAVIAVFAIGGLRTARKIPRVTPQYGAAQDGESAAASSPPVS